MPKKRGTRSGLRVSSARCEPQHFASCVERQSVSASTSCRIDGDGTGTANASSHTAGTAANGCHGGHGQAARAGTPTERSTAGRDERNLDGTQCWTQRSSTRWNPSTSIGRHGKPFEFQWRAYLIAQDRKYRELLEKIDDPTKDVRNVDSTWTPRTGN